MTSRRSKYIPLVFSSDMAVYFLALAILFQCGVALAATAGRFQEEWDRTIKAAEKEGHVTVYANEGIAQLIFLKADQVCEKSYADKGGKYQDQGGLTLPRVD